MQHPEPDLGSFSEISHVAFYWVLWIVFIFLLHGGGLQPYFLQHLGCLGACAHIHYCSLICHLCGSNSCPTHGSANAQVFLVIVGPSFFHLWNNAQICVSGMCCGAEQGLSYPNHTKHS